MKNHIIKHVLTIAVMLSFTACDEFLDVNTDPNKAPSSSLQLTLSPGISSTAYVIGGRYQITGAIWSQHWTQSPGAQQYRDDDSYDIQTDFLERQYSELFAGALNDLQYVKNTAIENEVPNYVLMAEVMQSYTWQYLADIYDKIPYSEALQQSIDFTPAFDDGEDIYTGIIERINAAQALDFSIRTNQTPGIDDLLFGGDMDAWNDFANTLKLKVFIRQSLARPTVSATGIAALYDANASFLDQDVTMTQFGTGQNKRNPYYETEVDRFGHVNVVASNTLLSYLQDNADPRVDVIFDKVGTTFVGVDQGDFFATTPTNASGASQPIVSAQSPVFLMSEAESYFLQAEAILRFPTETGMGDADAQAMYEAGVEASFVRLGLTAGDAAPLLAGAYQWTGSMDEKLQRIGEAKWVAMANIQGMEAYLEQLRLGYPDFLVDPVNTVLPAGQRPRRFLYPAIERDRNPDNTPAIVSLTTPVWWDVN